MWECSSVRDLLQRPSTHLHAEVQWVSVSADTHPAPSKCRNSTQTTEVTSGHYWIPRYSILHSSSGFLLMSNLSFSAESENIELSNTITANVSTDGARTLLDVLRFEPFWIVLNLVILLWLIYVSHSCSYYH